MKLLYCTDLDRTLIFSRRFIRSNNNNIEDCYLIEKSDDREISYISINVFNRLKEINNNENIICVPVTTRSIAEYNRIKLENKFKFAIVSSGGTILEDGNVIPEYEEFIKSSIDVLELMQVSLDLEELKSVHRESKFIDGKYVFTKTTDKEHFDDEITRLIYKYPNIVFTRQMNKVYAIPKTFNKAVATRWLQHYTKADKLLATGDSQLDLPMLAIADYAVIPNHGELVHDGYVVDGRIVSGGVDSPLQTFDILESIINEQKS